MKNVRNRFSLKSFAVSTLMLGAVLLTSVQAATTLRIATTHAPDQYASEVMQQVKKDMKVQELI